MRLASVLAVTAALASIGTASAETLMRRDVHGNWVAVQSVTTMEQCRHNRVDILGFKWDEEGKRYASILSEARKYGLTLTLAKLSVAKF